MVFCSHGIRNALVGGSIPSLGTHFKPSKLSSLEGFSFSCRFLKNSIWGSHGGILNAVFSGQDQFSHGFRLHELYLAANAAPDISPGLVVRRTTPWVLCRDDLVAKLRPDPCVLSQGSDRSFAAYSVLHVIPRPSCFARQGLG